MPSSLHETLLEMFRRWPALAAELLDGTLGVPVPAYDQATLEPTDFTDLTPTEYRSDAVVVFSTGGLPVLAVVVEVQLRRDPQKHWSWPVYVATLRARRKCPAVLLVMCVDGPTAAWGATPIELGPGSRVAPIVLGPRQVPVITDAGQAAREPEMAVLSAMAHGAAPVRRAVLDALLVALGAVDREHSFLYSEIVLSVLPAAARGYFLEAFMDITTYEPQSDFWRARFAEAKSYALAEVRAQGLAEGLAQGLAEGRAEGRAQGLAEAQAEKQKALAEAQAEKQKTLAEAQAEKQKTLAEAQAEKQKTLAEAQADGLAHALGDILEARGIDVPAEAGQRIGACADVELLRSWIHRAATVAAADELFG